MLCHSPRNAIQTSILIATLACAGPPTLARAADLPTMAVVYLRNDTDRVIKIDYRWGTSGTWKYRDLQPGERRYFYIQIPERIANTPPRFMFRYDRTPTEAESTVVNRHVDPVVAINSTRVDLRYEDQYAHKFFWTTQHEIGFKTVYDEFR
jgi:hypothetical protein